MNMVFINFSSIKICPLTRFHFCLSANSFLWRNEAKKSDKLMTNHHSTSLDLESMLALTMSTYRALGLEPPSAVGTIETGNWPTAAIWHHIYCTGIGWRRETWGTVCTIRAPPGLMYPPRHTPSRARRNEAHRLRSFLANSNGSRKQVATEKSPRSVGFQASLSPQR